MSPKSVQRPTDISSELRTVTTAASARPHLDFTMSIFPADGRRASERARIRGGGARGGLTGGEVDVGEEDDVGGDQRDQLGHADLLLEVHVHHVVVPEAAVGRRVELLQAGPQAAQEAEWRQSAS